MNKSNRFNTFTLTEYGAELTFDELKKILNKDYTHNIRFIDDLEQLIENHSLSDGDLLSIVLNAAETNLGNTPIEIFYNEDEAIEALKKQKSYFNKCGTYLGKSLYKIEVYAIERTHTDEDGEPDNDQFDYVTVDEI